MRSTLVAGLSATRVPSTDLGIGCPDAGDVITVGHLGLQRWGMFVLRVASAVLLGLVGLISLSMAWKGLSAGRLLPFHQAGTGREWSDLSPGERSVSTALTRSLGLGFLAAGLALVAAGVTAVVGQGVATYGLAGVGAVFCAGLALINRRLTLDTSVGTPWKQSLYAVVAILAALGLYAIG